MSLNQRKLALTEERDAYFSRLAELKVRNARFGYATDPVILTEIEDIELKLAKLDASIAALEIVAEQTPSSGITPDRRIDDFRLHIMIATVQATVGEFASLRVFVQHELYRQNRVLAFAGIAIVVMFASMFIGLAILMYMGNRAF